MFAKYQGKRTVGKYTTELNWIDSLDTNYGNHLRLLIQYQPAHSASQVLFTKRTLIYEEQLQLTRDPF